MRERISRRDHMVALFYKRTEGDGYTDLGGSSRRLHVQPGPKAEDGDLVVVGI
jgi:hypothetical protein